MKRTSYLILAVLGLMAVTTLAAPVAALDTGSRVNALNQSLKNDLWQTYGEHRLARLDNNVNAADDVIATLQKYNYDTTALAADVNTVRQSRGPLSDAITARNIAGIGRIDNQNLDTWKQFSQTLRALLKDQASGLTAGAGTS